MEFDSEVVDLVRKRTLKPEFESEVESMAVGTSGVERGAKLPAVRHVVRKLNAGGKGQWACRKTEGGVRVWRLA